MTTKLLLFAFYYLAIALFAPNPVDGPNVFSQYMLWLSLGFSVLAVFSFIWGILPDFEVKEEYEGERIKEIEGVGYVGSEVRV